MGNFSPSPFYTKEVDEFCKKYIYQATVDAMAAEGRPFTGVIFFGLMLTADGPRVLEYNARFGDPEAQVVLPRMKNDIIDVMEACVDGKLDAIDLQFEDNDKDFYQLKLSLYLFVLQAFQQLEALHIRHQQLQLS